MIHHHPDDALLLAHVAGSLDSGRALVAAAHVEGCAHCQARVRTLEALGGAVLDELDPALMAPEAFEKVLAKIDAKPLPRRPAPPSKRPALPAGIEWPRSMEGCTVSGWRWLGPGMRWSRVTLPHDAAANVFLLRIGAGKSLPSHTHSHCELTQVLYGSFDDGRAIFGPGDFDETAGEVHHQPVVQPGGECICLAAVNGKVMFDGTIARLLGSLVGM